jgi:hypothetical protein
MADDRTDPSDQVPDADLLDQQTPIEPPSLNVTEAAPLLANSIMSPVDEADRLEQQTPLPGGGEDDYPHDQSGAGHGQW